jgi:anaphase-promoting complex subunit 5
MGSPTKAHRHPAQASTSRLSEPSLPLHLALAHLIINLFPHLSTTAQSNPQINPYSSRFTSQILTIVAREVYEVLDTPRGFTELSNEVDMLFDKERRALERRNDKLRARGQAVPDDKERAVKNAHWMNDFVCDSTDTTYTKLTDDKANQFSTLSDGCTYLDSKLVSSRNDLD